MGKYIDNGMGDRNWVPDFPGDNPPAESAQKSDPGTPRIGGRYVLDDRGEVVWRDDVPDDSHKAANLTAELLRSQFADWQKLFKPIEMNAMQELSFNNPSVLTNAVDKAGGGSRATIGYYGRCSAKAKSGTWNSADGATGPDLKEIDGLE